MNCYYHTKENAVLHCKKCNKELCYDCYSMFKSHFCMDCEKEAATKNLIKSIATILVSIILAIITYVVFNKMEFIKNEFVYDVLSLIREFYNTIVTIFDYVGIKITDDLKNNLSMILCIYFLSSVPFGYYCLSKLSGYSISGSILAIIIFLYFKILISCFIGPIVMPVAIIISIVSTIKNIKRLSVAEKQEKKYMSEIIKNSTELKVVSEE